MNASSDIDLQSAIAQHGTIRAAGRALGIPESTIRCRIAKLPKLTRPPIPPAEMSAEELISHRRRAFERRKAHNQAKKNYTVRVDTDEPIALAFIGDPHLDDNNCNWEVLMRDVNIIRTTQNMYAVPGGDYINNWSGRLREKLSMHQEVTQDQGWKLVEWFVEKLKDSIIIMLKGNHDLWSKSHGNGDPLDWIAGASNVPMEDWSCDFTLQFKNGAQCRVSAAHDYKGNSQWNPLHGPMKKAKMSGFHPHVVLAADKHNWAMFANEDGETGHHYWVCRARGYKFHDEYAKVLGFDQQDHGCSIGVVIDPKAPEHERVHCFSSLPLAAQYLQFLLSKRKAAK